MVCWQAEYSIQQIKLIHVVVAGICIAQLVITACNKPSQLKCAESVDFLVDTLTNQFEADSVRISTARIKEELYFEPIICPVVNIYNPTTKIIDFKTLPLESRRLDNYDAIEMALKEEAKFIPQWMSAYCDLNEFNDIIVRFKRLDEHNRIAYLFVVHYKELLP